MQDAGHLISTVAAICGCLATGRSSLALAGIFGAGKTTIMTLILMWLALTTPSQVRLTVVSKENPAGQSHSGTGRTYGRAGGKEAFVLPSLEPPNGTLRKGGITPLMLPRGTRLVGYEFKVRKF